MNSLRRVVFFWFLGSLTLLIAVFILSVTWSGPLLVFSLVRHFGGGLIGHAAAQSVAAWEAGGGESVDRLEAAASSAGIRVILLDAGASLLRAPGRPLGPVEDLSRLARRTGPGAIELELRPQALRAAIQTTSGSGKRYFVILDAPRDYRMFGEWPKGIVLVRASMFLVFTALLCSWLAQRLSAPLRGLGASTRAFANGDLAARSGLDSTSQVREIRDLARDFDDMAGRIQSLLDSQTRLLQYVSHELRTPLTRVNLCIAAARRAGQPSADLDRIEAEVEHLNGLLHRILNLSRLEAAAQPLILQNIELADFLDTIVADADFEARAAGKQVLLAEAPVCHLMGDREWLRGAIENVIRNAIRYTPAGGAVTVTASQSLLQYRILIEDCGPGLPPGLERQIFEPFFRDGEGRGEGFGLGLAISRRVTELHGGQIRAANRPEGGLAVELLLPTPESRS